MPGGSAFTIPIRRSSPVQGYSKTFISSDVGISELPIPSSDDGGDGGNGSGEDIAMGEEEGEGKGEGASVGEYDDEWLMDTQSQGDKYFDCRRCAL